MTASAGSLPLEPGDEGRAVRDLIARLRALGHDTGDELARYGGSTTHAVRDFQTRRGLEPDGICGAVTWAALVEAGFQLGDRLIYLTSPMMRGDDVAALQLHLGALGFDAGRVDGIFGPQTRSALSDFQQNAGLVADEVCGPDTIAALTRLQPRAGHGTVAGVRERHSLRTHRRGVLQLRVALVHRGDAEALAGVVGSDLQRAGSATAVFGGDDWSDLADRVNDFGADLCIAVTIAPDLAQEVAYFETEGFSSEGGRSFGHLLLAELPRTPSWTIGTLTGMRLPILRETRPPSVRLKLGPPDEVHAYRALLASAIGRAVDRWARPPA